MEAGGFETRPYDLLLRLVLQIVNNETFCLEPTRNHVGWANGFVVCPRGRTVGTKTVPTLRVYT